jgi:opacity protein-like surface antigen
MKRLALVLAIASALPAPARAEDWVRSAEEEKASNSTTYVAVRLGAVMPKHDDLEGFDNGLALEGAVGFYVDKNIALELGVGRFAMSYRDSGYVDVGGYLYPATGTIDLAAYSVTGSAKLVLPVDKARLYALLGGGMYFMSGDAELDVEGFAPETESNSASAFGFHFGGGVEVRVSPRVSLGAEVKYIIGKVDLWDSGTDNNFDSMTLGAALSYAL